MESESTVDSTRQLLLTVPSEIEIEIEIPNERRNSSSSSVSTDSELSPLLPRTEGPPDPDPSSGSSSRLSSTSNSSSSMAVATPKRGGIHSTHGVYVGGHALDDAWKAVGRYQYASQRRGDKYVAKVEQHLTTARDSVSILKLHGTLELTGASITERDKDQFVRGVQQGLREHGQHYLYAIKKGTTVLDLLANHHIFTVTETLASTTSRETATDDSKYDEYKEDDFGLSRLLVERKLGEPLR
jgi:hypothetical protein